MNDDHLYRDLEYSWRRFKSAAPRVPLWLASASGGKRFGAVSVFLGDGKTFGCAVGDFLERSTGGMMDGRKKKKGFHDSIDLDWNARSEILLFSASLPLDQINDELGDVRTGDIGF